MTTRILAPEGWPAPRGYADGILVENGVESRLVVLSGQIGWGCDKMLKDGFVNQVEQALCNVVELLQAAGGGPSDLVRLTWYIVNIEDYRASRHALGECYRRIIGAYYPAMSVVAVSALVEFGALVEIEATANVKIYKK